MRQQRFGAERYMSLNMNVEIFKKMKIIVTGKSVVYFEKKEAED